MSFAGKFLAVLNLMALCAFFYLAVVTYQVRQAWAYANFRWDLALDGFPVDQKEPDARGRLRHLNLHYKNGNPLCQELIGNAEITTLEEFLDWRKGKILEKVKDPNVPGSKSDKLLEVLAAFASNAADRDKILSLKSTSYPPPDADRQLDVLMAVVRTEQERKRLEEMKKARKLPKLDDEVTALIDDRVKMLKELPLAPTKKDELSKKQAIARALVNFLDILPTVEEKKQREVEMTRAPEQRSDPLKDKDRTYEHTHNALGLRLMTQALERQGREALAMATDAGNSRQGERVNFAYQHQDLINLLIERQHQLQAQKDDLKTRIAQVAKQKEHAEEQKALVDRKKLELAQLRKETREGVKDPKGQLLRDKRGYAVRPGLEQLEDEIARVYRLRLRLRDANRINQEMEAEIRKIESEKR